MQQKLPQKCKFCITIAKKLWILSKDCDKDNFCERIIKNMQFSSKNHVKYVDFVGKNKFRQRVELRACICVHSVCVCVEGGGSYSKYFQSWWNFKVSYEFGVSFQTTLYVWHVFRNDLMCLAALFKLSYMVVARIALYYIPFRLISVQKCVSFVRKQNINIFHWPRKKKLKFVDWPREMWY